MGCNDFAIYYIRQVGNKVWWYGETNPYNPNWSNAFYGTIGSSSPGDVINGDWADVPKGKTSYSGTLRLMIETKQQTGCHATNRMIWRNFLDQADLRIL